MSKCLGEITVFKKSNGPLTKHIALRDGKIVNDSSACFMARGSAHRARIDSVQALADLINNFAPNQAYALGRLKDGIPDGAKVVRKDELNGAKDPSIIARTLDHLVFKEGEPASFFSISTSRACRIRSSTAWKDAAVPGTRCVRTFLSSKPLLVLNALRPQADCETKRPAKPSLAPVGCTSLFRCALPTIFPASCLFFMIAFGSLAMAGAWSRPRAHFFTRRQVLRLARTVDF